MRERQKELNSVADPERHQVVRQSKIAKTKGESQESSDTLNYTFFA